jgi:hypothetical protein
LFAGWSRLEWVVDDGIARVVSRFDSWACCGQTDGTQRRQSQTELEMQSNQEQNTLFSLSLSVQGV